MTPLHTTKEIGRIGERIAARYLKRHGYRILKRNLHCGKNELDILAKNRQYLVFVEVKTRKNQSYLPASAAVGREKQRRITASAMQWIAENESRDQFSFDIIEVYTEDKTIRHIQNAFV